MYEIYSDGRESLYKSMSLRELLHYLNAEVHAIDRRNVPNTTENAKALDQSLKEVNYTFILYVFANALLKLFDPRFQCDLQSKQPDHCTQLRYILSKDP